MAYATFVFVLVFVFRCHSPDLFYTYNDARYTFFLYFE